MNNPEGAMGSGLRISWANQKITVSRIGNDWQERKQRRTMEVILLPVRREVPQRGTLDCEHKERESGLERAKSP